MTEHAALLTGPIRTILKPRHEAFVLRFVETGNATEAYVAAGFARSGAEQSASRLLRRADIKARIAEVRSEIAKELGAREQENAKVALQPIVDRKQKILEELELLGFSDLMNYQVREDGWIEVKGDLPPELSRAIESIKVTKRPVKVGDDDWGIETRTEFKLWSKPTALKMLGEHEMLFGQKLEDRTPSDRPAQVFIIAGRQVYL